MSKEQFVSLILFVGLFIGALYYTNTLQKPLLYLSDSVKTIYLDTSEYIGHTIEEHFNQRKTIIAQRKQLEKYKKSHLLALQFASELNSFFDEFNSSIKLKPEVTLVRTLSYAKFGDHHKLWLDFKEFNSSKVYGLTHEGFAAGIVVSRNERPLAMLNGDRKSAYSVYVGDEAAPGIVHGNGIDRLIVEYIPTWKHVNKGDEVITSGLDELFFKGMKVGIVESIEHSQGYLTAIVQPYFNATDARYFHVIKAVH